MAANTPISLSNVNVLLNEPANTPLDFDSAIFRSLAGNANFMTPGSYISFSTLNNANAVGYAGFTANTTNINVAGFGIQTTSIILTANTTMYGANVVWNMVVNSGNNNAVLTLLNGGYASNASLTSNVVGTWSSNVTVSCSLSFGGHLIGSSNNSYTLNAQVYDPALVVSGNLTVTASGYAAQTVSTIVQASTNNSLTGAVYQFIVNPPTGAVVSNSSVVFTSFISTRGAQNVQSWSLTTNVLLGSQIIATNTCTVNATATYLVPTFQFSAPASTNAQFANAAPTTASLTYTASQNISGANLSWSVTGPATLVSNTTSATVSLTSAANTYGFTQANGVITATVYLIANGYILTTNSAPYSLEVGNYGLSYNPPAASLLANGYLAQTATTTASATYKAGNFLWIDTLNAGSPATINPAYANGSATCSLTLGTTSPNSLTSNNTLVAQITSPLSNLVATALTAPCVLTATQLPYSFSLAGPTTNTQINATPTLSLTASSNVVTPTFVYTFSSPSIAFSNTATTTSFSLTNASPGACSSSATLTTALYSNSVYITTLSTPISLALFNPNLSWSSPLTASNVGYAAAEPVSLQLSATIASGANLSISSTATSSPAAPASSSVTGGSSSNSTVQSLLFSAQQGSGVVGNITASWNVFVQVLFAGVTQSYSNSISITSGVTDSGASLTWSNASSASFSFPVSATTTMTATSAITGGSWIFSSSGSPTSVSGNTVSLSATQNSPAASNTTSASVTANLYDAAGKFVKTLSASLSATATSTNPGLTLAGPTSVSASNTFNCTSVANYNAGVSSSFANPTYHWSFTRNSGSTANSTSSSGNTAQVVLGLSGVGSSTTSYTVTCAVANGAGANLASQSITTTLSDSCPAPSYSLTTSNAASSGYNYPVTATSYVTASSNPSGSVTMSYSLASGSSSGITINQTSSGATCQYSFTASESAIGTVSAVYNVTANYYSPSGVYLNSFSTQVSVSATRLDVGLGIALPSGGTTYYTGFGTVSGTNYAQATLSSGIGGVTYNWTNSYYSGTGSSFAASGNTYTQTLTTGASAASEYQVGVTAVLNGQVVAGPVYAYMQVSCTVCYLNMYTTPANGQDIETGGATAQVTVFANTNYPYSGNISWSWAITNGTGAGITIGQASGNGYYLNFDGNPPCNSYYTVTATVPGTSESNSVSIYLEASAACVDVLSFVRGEDGLVLAGQIGVAETLVITDPAEILGSRLGVVQHSSPVKTVGRRVITLRGVTLKCSSSAKIPYLSDAGIFYSEPDGLMGKLVPVEIKGERFYDIVVAVEEIGELEVQHLTVENACFWAGEQPGLFMLHHNKKVGCTQCVAISTQVVGGSIEDVEEGSTFALSGNRWGVVKHQKKIAKRSVRILTDNGVALVCTRSAPIATIGGLKEAQDLLGEHVYTSVHGHQSIGRIIGVEEVGWRNVNHVWTSIL